MPSGPPVAEQAHVEADEKAGCVSRKLPPDKLYKHRSLAGDQLNYTEAIFARRQLWVSSSAQLNDPFECRAVASDEATEEAMIQRIKQYVSRELPHLRDPELTSEAVKRKHAFERRGWEHTCATIASEAGVCSFSEVSTDILMWSHYADSHQGVCIEFDFSIDSAIRGEEARIWWLGHTRPVRYALRLPHVNVYATPYEQIVSALFLTKALHWDYEREWRLLDPDDGPGPKDFPNGFVSGVIIGCRMPDENRKRVSGWIRDYCPDATLYEARVSSTSYSLDIVPVQ